jgi:hypothetical protein
MKRISAFILILNCLFYFITASAQYKDKCNDVLKVLDKVRDACEAYPPQDYCNIFVGSAVKDIYGIDDFVAKGLPTGYYRANKIADLLSSDLSDKWENLGTCDNQDVLNKAQNDANSNRCVIAIWKDKSSDTAHGHIALILPGNLKAGWRDMMVPNSANFSLGTDIHNFVCGGLSGAFGYEKRNSIILYVHKD